MITAETLAAERVVLDRKSARAIRAFAREVERLASNESTIESVKRASDRAYRAARFANDVSAANDAIDVICRKVEAAIESAHQLRQAARCAEMARLREEDRVARRATDWMRR